MVYLPTARIPRESLKRYPLLLQLVRRPPIFNVYTRAISHTAYRHETHAKEKHRVPGPIIRPVASFKTKCRGDTAQVPEPKHPCCTDAALEVAAQVHGVPHDPQRQSTEDAESDEESAGVFGVDVGVDAEEDGGADDSDGEGEEDEAEAVPQTRGHEGDADGVEPCDSEGWYRVQLRLDGRILEAFNDGGEEVRDTIGGERATWVGLLAHCGWRAGKRGKFYLPKYKVPAM